MTITEIIAYGAEYGTTLTVGQIKEFFAKHSGNPSALELAIFVGAMDENFNKLPKKEDK